MNQGLRTEYCHQLSSGSLFKSYRLYILEHIPRRHSSHVLMGYVRPPTMKRIIVVPDFRGIYSHEHYYIWKEVSTGHYIWSPKTNFVKEYTPKVLKDIVKKKKKIFTLLQKSFFALSTLDLSSLKHFCINPLFREEQGGCLH